MSTTPRKGRVIVTCGPSFEPIDQVRRLTNQSTGKLGILLANRLARSGWDTICFKGEGATCPDALVGAERVTFSTNDDLLRRLTALPYRDEVAAIFHVAALCDFKVKQATGADGVPLDSAKISSRAGEVTLTLEPATKIIGQLRALFPHSRIVGWKYELNGKREDAIEKGWNQIAQNGTDACVVNGAAYGEGFGVLERAGSGIAHLEDRTVLCEWLAGWVRSKRWLGAQ
ncbi:phosphopantothenoylcysteine decarboxylase domain-containing protein [Verrucomicrobiota bacterium sgz303538]